MKKTFQLVLIFPTMQQVWLQPHYSGLTKQRIKKATAAEAFVLFMRVVMTCAYVGNAKRKKKRFRR